MTRIQNSETGSYKNRHENSQLLLAEISGERSEQQLYTNVTDGFRIKEKTIRWMCTDVSYTIGSEITTSDVTHCI